MPTKVCQTASPAIAKRAVGVDVQLPKQGGAGEKEKAYAIRTNSCLKIVLTLMVLFSITLFVLSQTVFQARNNNGNRSSVRPSLSHMC